MPEKEEEGRKRGGGRGQGGKCLTFSKGIINSLSALVLYPADVNYVNYVSVHRPTYNIK